MSNDNADRRSVATDALATLGTVPLGPDERRDAIHLAVEPVVAGHYLEPGDHITVKGGAAMRTEPGKGLGIVDPFLPRPVQAGERFWFIMYPRQVRSLRHVWSHPAFPDEASAFEVAATTTGRVASGGEDVVARARTRIGEIADALGDDMSYARLMGAAEEWLDSGDYLVQHDSQRWQDTFYEYAAEFWTLFEVVTGRGVPAAKRESFFSCSC